MLEVLTESIRLVNLPFTVLLVGLLLYWLMVMVGLLQFDTGADTDFHVGGESGMDVGVDANAHVDAGADLAGDVGDVGDVGDAGTGVDGDAGGDLSGDAQADGGPDHGHSSDSHGPGLLAGMLKFIHLGDVPAMVVISVQALCMWMCALIANHYWNDNSLVRGLVFVVPNVLLSAVLTRYITWPMARFFRALNREYSEHKPLIGRTCMITTSEVTDRFGQAQIETRGAPVIINVRTTQAQPLRKGDTALVVREDKETHLYYVRKVTPEKLEA